MSQTEEMLRQLGRIRREVEAKAFLHERCPYVIEIAIMQDLLMDGLRFAWRYKPATTWSQSGPYPYRDERDMEEILTAVAACMRMEKP